MRGERRETSEGDERGGRRGGVGVGGGWMGGVGGGGVVWWWTWGGGVAWRCWHLVESTRDDLIFVKRRMGSLDT